MGPQKKMTWISGYYQDAFAPILYLGSVHNLAPDYLCDLIVPYNPVRSLCSESKHLSEQAFRLKSFGGRAFSTCTPKLWNSLPISLRSETDLDTFKRNLRHSSNSRVISKCDRQFFSEEHFRTLRQWWKCHTNLNVIHSFIGYTGVDRPGSGERARTAFHIKIHRWYQIPKFHSNFKDFPQIIGDVHLGYRPLDLHLAITTFRKEWDFQWYQKQIQILFLVMVIDQEVSDRHRTMAFRSLSSVRIDGDRGHQGQDFGHQGGTQKLPKI
jgi:hypothetical protein